MKQILFFIIVILVAPFSLALYVSAQNQIPDIILNQKLELDKYTTEQNTTIYLPKKLPFTTKLIDWRMSSEEEAIKIAESFIKNSEAELGVSLEDLRRDRTAFDKEQDHDYLNPSATIFYKQYYHEIPLYYGGIRISINAYGVVVGFGVNDFEEIIKNITAPTTPIISSAEAEKIIETRYNQTRFKLEKAAELFIYDNKLAWRFNIFAPVFKEVFVDSQTGEIILERNNFVTEVSTSTPTPTPTSTLTPIPIPSDININKNDNTSANPKQIGSIYYYVIPIIIAGIVLLAYFILRKRQ